ncbi:hypothetical protein JTB14_035077 [Gonioctena quinquepunctata]|nr:hypothetical protein JTB14_035077 [Gonioctena quinquepunctata]
MNEKNRKSITKIDKKNNPHKKGMQMILRNNTQKQRNQLEETALQVYREATDEQEYMSIGSLSSDLEEHSFIVSNSEKTPEDINKKSLLEELETAQSILVHEESAKSEDSRYMEKVQRHQRNTNFQNRRCGWNKSQPSTSRVYPSIMQRNTPSRIVTSCPKCGYSPLHRDILQREEM